MPSFECNVDGCNYSSPWKSNLNRHLKGTHVIGLKWWKCDQCDKKYKNSSHLKRHHRSVHSTEEDWFVCKVEGCNYKCPEKPMLRSHKKNIHKKCKKWFSCTVDGCKFKAKAQQRLDLHTNRKHDSDAEEFACNKCDYTTVVKGNLHRHKRIQHREVRKWFPCDKCKEKCESRRDLDYHRAMVHDIDRHRFICGHEGCSHSSKNIPDMKRHKAYGHDLGNKECEICCRNVFKLFTIRVDKQRSRVCCVCYQKMSGKESRVEKRMSEYLDNHYGTEFLLVSDSIIKGELCQKYRPDKMYADPERVIHIECDEYQHTRKSNGSDYTCDEKRISNIYDEFPGKEYIVIRWNPHGFHYPEGKWSKEKKPGIKSRLEMLVQLLERLSDITFESPIIVIYMFYSSDNPIICQNIPNLMICREEEIEEL